MAYIVEYSATCDECKMKPPKVELFATNGEKVGKFCMKHGMVALRRQTREEKGLESGQDTAETSDEAKAGF